MPLYYAVYLPPAAVTSVEQLSSLPSLLETREGYDAFHEFVKLEFALENLYFWKAIREYRATCAHLAQDQESPAGGQFRALLDDARKIYTDYIEVGAANYEVNVSGEVRGAAVFCCLFCLLVVPFL